MKILILGSTGFVGRNLVDSLDQEFHILKSARIPPDSSYIYFDLTDRPSWTAILETDPDLIINASAYGVIKHQTDLEVMYSVNYFQPAALYEFLMDNKSRAFWLQIGTAFEYDLSISGGLTEGSNCLPRTHYGISKLMFSQFLRAKSTPGKFLILRPFGMFGRYEDDSKFFPTLLNSQRFKQAVKLSAGLQQRDYFFVDDLGEFINSIIKNNGMGEMPCLINLGSGEARSLRDYSFELSLAIQDYDNSLWQWGAIDTRANESVRFFNSSPLANALGFRTRTLQESFLETTRYYFSK